MKDEETVVNGVWKGIVKWLYCFYLMLSYFKVFFLIDDIAIQYY